MNRDFIHHVERNRTHRPEQGLRLPLVLDSRPRLSMPLLRNWATTVEAQPPYGPNLIVQGQQSQRDGMRQPRMQIRGNRTDVHSKSQRDDRC